MEKGERKEAYGAYRLMCVLCVCCVCVCVCVCSQSGPSVGPPLLPKVNKISLFFFFPCHWIFSHVDYHFTIFKQNVTCERCSSFTHIFFPCI